MVEPVDRSLLAQAAFEPGDATAPRATEVALGVFERLRVADLLPAGVQKISDRHTTGRTYGEVLTGLVGDANKDGSPDVSFAALMNAQVLRSGVEAGDLITTLFRDQLRAASARPDTGVAATSARIALRPAEAQQAARSGGTTIRLELEADVSISAQGVWSLQGAAGNEDQIRAAAVSAIYRAAATGVPVFDSITDRRQLAELRQHLTAVYTKALEPTGAAADADAKSVARQQRLRAHSRAGALHLLGEVAKAYQRFDDPAGARFTTEHLWRISHDDPDLAMVQFVYGVMIREPSLADLPRVKQIRQLLYPSHPPAEWYEDGELNLVLYVDDKAMTGENLQKWLAESFNQMAGMPWFDGSDLAVEKLPRESEYLYKITASLAGPKEKRIPVTIRIANPDERSWYDALEQEEVDIVASFGHGGYTRGLERRLAKSPETSGAGKGLWAFQCWGLASFQEVKARHPEIHFLSTADVAQNQQHIAAFWTSLAGVARRQSWRETSADVKGSLMVWRDTPRFGTPAEMDIVAPFLDRDLDGLTDDKDRLYLPPTDELQTVLHGIDPTETDLELYELPGAALRRAVLDLRMLFGSNFVGRERSGLVLDENLFIASGYFEPKPEEANQPFRFTMHETPQGNKEVSVSLNRNFAPANERMLGKMLALEAGRFVGRELGLGAAKTEGLMLALMLKAFEQQNQTPIRDLFEEPLVEFALLRRRYSIPDFDWRKERDALPELFDPSSFEAFVGRTQELGLRDFVDRPPRRVAEDIELPDAMQLWALGGMEHRVLRDLETLVEAIPDLAALGVQATLDVTGDSLEDWLRGSDSGPAVIAGQGDERVLIVRHPTEPDRLIRIPGFPTAGRLEATNVWWNDESRSGLAGLVAQQPDDLISPKSLSLTLEWLEHDLERMVEQGSPFATLTADVKLEENGFFRGPTAQMFRFETSQSGGRTLVKVAINERFAHAGFDALTPTLGLEIGSLLAKERSVPGADGIALGLALANEFVLDRSPPEARLFTATLFRRYGLRSFEEKAPTDHEALIEMVRGSGLTTLPEPRPVGEVVGVAIDARLEFSTTEAELRQLIVGLQPQVSGLAGARLLGFDHSPFALIASFSTPSSGPRQLVLTLLDDGSVGQILLFKEALGDFLSGPAAKASPDEAAPEDTEGKSGRGARQFMLGQGADTLRSLRVFAAERQRALQSLRVSVEGSSDELAAGPMFTATSDNGRPMTIRVEVPDRLFEHSYPVSTAIGTGQLAMAFADGAGLSDAERWALVAFAIKVDTQGWKVSRRAAALGVIAGELGLPAGLDHDLLESLPDEPTPEAFERLVASIDPTDPRWKARPPRWLDEKAVPELVGMQLIKAPTTPGFIEARLDFSPMLRGSRLIGAARRRGRFLVRTADGALGRLTLRTDRDNRVLAAAFTRVDASAGLAMVDYEPLGPAEALPVFNGQTSSTLLPDPPLSSDEDQKLQLKADDLLDSLFFLSSVSFRKREQTASSDDGERTWTTGPTERSSAARPVVHRVFLPGPGVDKPTEVTLTSAGAFSPEPSERQAFQIEWETRDSGTAGPARVAKIAVSEHLLSVNPADLRGLLAVELAFSYAQHARLDADAATQLAAELARETSFANENQLGAYMLRLRYPALQDVPLDRLSTRTGFNDVEGFNDAEQNQRDDTSNLRAAGPLGEVREVGTALNVATPGGVVRTGQGSYEVAESIKEVLGSIEGLNVEPLLAMRWNRQPAVVARHADGTRVIIILRTDAYDRVIGARSVPYSDELGILESGSLGQRYREPATAPSLPVNAGGALVHQGTVPAKTSLWLEAIEKELPDLDTVELIDGGYFPAAANDYRFADFSVKQTATGEQVTTRISSRYRRSGRLDEAMTAYELTVFLHDRQGTSEEEQGWRALHAAALLFASERGDMADLLLLCKRYNVAPDVAERLLGFLNPHRIYDMRLRDPEAGYAYRRTHVTFEAFMREVASGATRPPATQPRVVGKIVDISGYHLLEASASDSRGSGKPQVDQEAVIEVIRQIPDLAGSRVLLSKWRPAWIQAGRRGNRVVDVRTMDASGRVGWVQLSLDNNGVLEEVIQVLP